MKFSTIPVNDDDETDLPFCLGSYIMSFSEANGDNLLNTLCDVTVSKVVNAAGLAKIKSKNHFGVEHNVDESFVDVVSRDDVLCLLETALRRIEEAIENVTGKLLTDSLKITRQVFETNAHEELQNICRIAEKDSQWKEYAHLAKSILNYCAQNDIFEAIWHSDWETVDRLLDCSGVQDMRGRIPLHYAARFNAPDHILRSLYNSFTEGIQVKDNQGRTPLDYAIVSMCNISTINILAERYFVTF